MDDVDAGDSATFSAAEAAVYDRQMRLWGVEAQKRLQNSQVFVSGLSALGSELVKNLVLSGMNATVHDSHVVTQSVVDTQFFFFEADLGKNRAEACLEKVKELNPLVNVNCETAPLAELDDAFFHKFTAICLIGADKQTELRLDALCRERGIAFFTACSFGFDGIVFADLGSHKYRRTPSGTNAPATASDPITVEFPTLAEANQVKWGTLQSARKRGPQIPRVYVKHQRVDTIGDDFAAFAHVQLEAQGLAMDFFSAEELSSLAEVANVDLVPVCAILAGILGQEIVKAISQKDEPICNYFCFDGATGTVRQIG
ncbi:Sumo-activating enzyme subunit 1, partial [Globisporangium splendens]